LPVGAIGAAGRELVGGALIEFPIYAAAKLLLAIANHP